MIDYFVIFVMFELSYVYSFYSDPKALNFVVFSSAAPEPVKRRRPRPTGAVFDEDEVGEIQDPFAVSRPATLTKKLANSAPKYLKVICLWPLYCPSPELFLYVAFIASNKNVRSS